MGRVPCCEKVGLKRGRWTAEEDEILTKYIQANGEGLWRSLPKNAGLLRCGKSCRLRWINYLRSDVKRGNISSQEEEAIIKLHASLGNRWSLIASHLTGRTDNEIKNYWNSHLSRKIQSFKRSPICEEHRKSIVINNLKKRKRGRTSRSDMKKPKIYAPISENHVTEVIPMPPTPTLEEERENLVLLSTNEDREDELMETHEAFENGMLCLNDIMGDGEVDPCGVLEEKENNMKVKEIDCGIRNENGESSGNLSLNGEWYPSCSTDSFIDGENFEWNWEWDGGVQENELWGEEEKMMSWLWESSDNGDNGEGDCNKFEGEGDSKKEDAMVAWLLS